MFNDEPLTDDAKDWSGFVDSRLRGWESSMMDDPFALWSLTSEYPLVAGDSNALLLNTVRFCSSAFWLILRRIAFCDDNVLLMMHRITPENAWRTVETSIIQPPHLRWDTNSRMSTRNASNVMRNDGSEKIITTSRYLCEEPGPCKNVSSMKISRISDNPAATTCTISKFDNDRLALDGSLKLLSSSGIVYPIPAFEHPLLLQ
jgi:hypothetical protein